MSLSADLISQFVKATNDNKKEKSETTVYGTIVKYADKFYVQLDGSDQLTPYESTTDVAEGDRVAVRIKNHIATVSGNLKSPSARVDDLKGLAQTVLEMDTVLANKVDTKLLQAETARIDSLVAENATITGKLTAAEADILKIKTDYLDAKAIDAKYATIENLNSTNATVHNLTSTYGAFADLTTTRLNAAEAVIDKLDVTYAKLGEFTAVKGRVESLEAGVADIDTLIFGSATGTTIQTSFANSVIAQLGDAQIKSAMIDSLSASKITAGKISTNLVQIASDDNSMLISDGTIQISDGSHVRVQIGKDASNDYSINIWDANGKLLFSEGGITENAIKSSIIRNDMVADNANISASKLDIDSLFEEINGSEKTIKSTRVYLDEKNQTLDVSFKQITSDVEGLDNSVKSQGTAIFVIQGQISSKIWKQDIDDATGVMNTKYSTLEQSLNGFKTTVGETYATKATVISLESQINQTNNNITLAVKEITIGGTNLLGGTKNFTVKTNDTSGYSYGDATETNETYQDFKVRYLKSTTTANGYNEFAHYTAVVDAEGGCQYTFSFYAKGTKIRAHFYNGGYKVVKGVSSQNVQNAAGDGNMDFTLTSEWKRYWVTYTVEDTNTQSSDINKNVLLRLYNGNEAYVCGLMFEKGNKPSDWSPHPEDTNNKFASLEVTVNGINQRVSDSEGNIATLQTTASGLTSRVASAEGNIATLQTTAKGLTYRLDNLRGTNLLRNTRNPQDSSYWTRGNIVKDSELNENVFYISNSATSEQTAGTYRISVIAGVKYTISAYVKRSSNVNSIDFFFLSRKKGETADFTIIQNKIGMVPTADVWTKLTWTFTMDSNAYEGYFRIDHNGSANSSAANLYYTMIKMELGDTATDWTSSEEDACDASKTATNYLNFSSSGLVVGNHTATSLKGNVLIDNDSIDIRNGSTVLSTFTADSVRLGLTSSKNVIVNTDGVHLYEGSTYMAYFKPTEVRLGNKAGSNSNIKIANDLITFRAGNTETATYGSNEIHLGLNGQDTTIYLCADIGSIVGYEDDYGMGINVNAYNLMLNSTNRVHLEAYKDPGTGPWGQSSITVLAGNANGVNRSISLVSYGGSSYGVYNSFSEILIEDKKVSLSTEDTNKIGSITITPTYVEIGPSLKVNGRTYDQNKVLWSGGRYMDASHTNTLSESISNQPNGIVLVFSEYISNASSNTAFHTRFIPKNTVESHGGVGHCIQLSSSNLNYFTTKYLYIHDTKIVGHDNNKLTGTSNSGITYTNTRFVLRYVIGV